MLNKKRFLHTYNVSIEDNGLIDFVVNNHKLEVYSKDDFKNMYNVIKNKDVIITSYSECPKDKGIVKNNKALEIYGTLDEAKEIYDDIVNLQNYELNNMFHKNEVKMIIKTTGGDNDLINKLSSLMFDFSVLPAVGVITNTVLRKINIEDYVYLDKTDGVRKLLLSDGVSVYEFYKNELTLIGKSNAIFMIDTEYLNNTYHVFDKYFVDIDIRREKYEDRMKYNTPVKFNNSKHKLVNKTFTKITKDNIKKVFELGMKIRKGFDGIIFQSCEGYTKWLKGYYQYKLKPLELITTDYLYIKKPNTEDYYLFLSGNIFELIFNLRSNPRELQEAYNLLGFKLKSFTNEKIVNILFDTPLFNNAHIYNFNKADLKVLKEEIENNENLCDKVKKEYIERINNNDLNNMIIETQFVNQKQRPIRIRWDKVHPNSYKTGLSNMSIIFSPPTIDDSYFQKIDLDIIKNNFNVSCPEEFLNLFHTLNQNIRDYIFKLIRLYMTKNTKTVMDICGGRGAELNRILSLNYNNIIGIDGDTEALVSYQNKGLLYKILNKEFNARLNLNLHKYIIGNDKVDNIIKEIKERNEFLNPDIFIMNYAFHYLCNDKYKSNISDLVKLIKETKNNKSIFVMSFYDGEKILSTKKFKTFNIKTKVIKDDYILANMPLPTIETSGYREEPLVLSQHIEYLSKSLSKSNCIIYNDYPYKYISDSKTENYLDDYLSCIKVIIFEI